MWGFPPLPGQIFFNLMDGVLLIDALKAAHAKKMWGKFTFYVDACEASSVFVFEGWGDYARGPTAPRLPTTRTLMHGWEGHESSFR